MTRNPLSSVSQDEISKTSDFVLELVTEEEESHRDEVDGENRVILFFFSVDS